MKMAVGYCLLVAALVQWPASAMADCQCRANGRSFEQGEVACLRLPNGTELARCGKELNNSSWKKVQDGCPSAAADPIRQSWMSQAVTALEQMLPQDHDHPASEEVNVNQLW
jgi:hypothetical protein